MWARRPNRYNRRRKASRHIIVDGNLLKDIEVLQDKNRIKMVMKEGKIEVNRDS